MWLTYNKSGTKDKGIDFHSPTVFYISSYLKNKYKTFDLFGTQFLKTIFMFINQKMEVQLNFNLFGTLVCDFILKNWLGILVGPMPFFKRAWPCFRPFFETGFIFFVLLSLHLFLSCPLLLLCHTVGHIHRHLSPPLTIFYILCEVANTFVYIINPCY